MSAKFSGRSRSCGLSRSAALGIHQIGRAPEVLAAINPDHGIRIFREQRLEGFVVLGAVFLAITGGEALYADIGHFGTETDSPHLVCRRPAGTGAELLWTGRAVLVEPDSAVNPFFRMTPSWALYPMVILATAAAVIASQAIISGAFSLTMQAIQLGYMPRLKVNYTSERMIGQIYVPVVNWALMICCIGLVLGFRSSSNLAAAYGVAITTTMLITTILFYVVARRRWHWPAAVAVPVAAFFIIIDLAFFRANMLKIAHGGWFPLLVSAVILFLMLTWRKGRRVLRTIWATSAFRSIFSSRSGEPKYSACARHGRFHVGQPIWHAAGATPQSQAQQSAA